MNISPARETVSRCESPYSCQSRSTFLSILQTSNSMAFQRFDDRNPVRVQDTVTSPENSHEDMSGKQDGMSHREVSGFPETRAAAMISDPTPSGPGDRTDGEVSIATIGLGDKRHFDREVVTAAEVRLVMYWWLTLPRPPRPRSNPSTDGFLCQPFLLKRVCLLEYRSQLHTATRVRPSPRPGNGSSRSSTACPTETRSTLWPTIHTRLETIKWRTLRGAA